MTRSLLLSSTALVFLASPSVFAVPEASEPARFHVELDPLPFAHGGYGGQIGYRAAALPRLRVAVASFSLDVPDFAAQLGDGNDGFHLRVRPSAAVYALYFLSDTHGGVVAGGSLRYLRLEYSHDDSPGEQARLGQLSVEAIVGFKYHPWPAGFYVQPWLGIARTLTSSDDPVVDGHAYNELPLQLFATVNLGWELELR